MKLANPTGHGPRDTDKYGSGLFDAPRDGGTRRHRGLDILSVPGQLVSSPIYGTIIREKRPYGDGSACDRGVLIEGRGEHKGLAVTLFYVRVGDGMMGRDVGSNEVIGIACSLDGKYPGISSHVHLEVVRDGEYVDPLPLVFCGSVGLDKETYA